MRAEEDRRAFITSAACGVPLLATASAAAFARSFRSVDHDPVGVRDPLVNHVDERLAGILREALAPGRVLHAEEARAGAAHLQILAVHAGTAQLNARTRRGLRRRIASTGRDALAREPIDLPHVRTILGRRGVTLPTRFDDPAAITVEHRQLAIEMVLAGRTSSAFAHLAATLDALAPRLPQADAVRLDIRQSSIWELLSQPCRVYFGLAGVLCSTFADDVDLQMWCEALGQGALLADSANWSHC